MAATTTMTVRLSPKLKKKLGVLAKNSRRTHSFLAAEAIADYVERENETIAAIKRGLADMKAGRTIPHEEVMEQIFATIRAVEKRQIEEKQK